MPGLILWKNEEITKFKRDIDRLFSRLWDDFGIRLTPSTVGGMPHFSMSETEDFLVIQAELPGVDPADLEVSISDDLLTIRGKSREERLEQEADSYRTEKRYGFFSRSLRLPCKILADEAKATYKSGILRIALPKCKVEPPREVKIHIQ